ncbi:MAG: type II secretion system protein GspG [Halioglobus sp.]
MIRSILLVLVLALTACSSDVQKAKELLADSLVITADLQFQEVTGYKGDVVCGSFSATTSYTSQPSVNQPFIVLGKKLDKSPSPLEWQIYCSNTPAIVLHENTGIGPFDKTSAELIKITKDFTLLTSAMEAYYTDVFSYPSEEQGLLALVSKPEGNSRLKNYREGGYLPQLPQDPWGMPYLYSHTQWGRVKAPFEITTLGKSGEAGGSGLEADVYSSLLPYLKHIFEILSND